MSGARDDLRAQLLATATSIYVARAGEMVGADNGSKGKVPFDCNHAVTEAARLINAVTVSASAAFEQAARETHSASLWGAIGK